MFFLKKLIAFRAGFRNVFFLLLCGLLLSANARGFGILTHEAIIDATWDKSILPLLKTRFPQATPQELEDARAYVYGGSILPDIGYHPFGSIFFSELFHYVRTGDFITALLEESKSLDEYAFAVGALCHYVADEYGHADGTNRVVPLLFPKLKKKYGNDVSYGLAPVRHIQVEFGFDVLQTAKGNYEKAAYHKFIEFKVNKPVLERAFRKTYGLQLDDVFRSLDVSVETFRFSVKSIIPELTRDAWRARKSAISKLNPLATEENFYYRESKRDYKLAHRDGIHLKSTFITLLVGVLPKIGPLAVFKFKEPTEEGERLYDKSFNEVRKQYADALAGLRTGVPRLTNINLDTGEKTTVQEYELASETYDKLVRRHRRNGFKNISPELRKNMLAFYRNPQAAQKSGARHEKALTELISAN